MERIILGKALTEPAHWGCGKLRDRPSLGNMASFKRALMDRSIRSLDTRPISIQGPKPYHCKAKWNIWVVQPLLHAKKKKSCSLAGRVCTWMVVVPGSSGQVL